MPRVALVLNGLVFTFVGGMTLADPVAMLGSFGVVMPTPVALAHLRSIQGGGMTSAGLLMWLALWRPDLRRPALVTAAFVMWGFALGRLLGVVVDGAADPAILSGSAIEALLGALAVVALRRDGTTGDSVGPA